MSTVALAPPSAHGCSSPPSPHDNTASLPVRPKFNSHITSDRLREGAGLVHPALNARASNIRKGRTSVFREMGLEDDVALFGTKSETYLSVADKNSSRTETSADDGDDAQMEQASSKPWYAKLAAGRPGLNKRLSSQGRVAIPTVTVVGAETQ